MVDKWMQKIKHTGALREYFGVKEGDTIPEGRLNALIEKLKGKEEKSAKELKLLKEAVAAKNMREANK
jgi:hypothetical protein